MKQYRHTITLVTEFDKDYMPPHLIKIFDAMSDKDKIRFLKESAKDMMKDLLVKANDRGTWAILKVAE
jgi:hypothetical protein